MVAAGAVHPRSLRGLGADRDRTGAGAPRVLPPSADDRVTAEATPNAYQHTAVRNHDLGIEAVAGVTDGGRNREFANGNALQCLNIAC